MIGNIGFGTIDNTPTDSISHGENTNLQCSQYLFILEFLKKNSTLYTMLNSRLEEIMQELYKTQQQIKDCKENINHVENTIFKKIEDMENNLLGLKNDLNKKNVADLEPIPKSKTKTPTPTPLTRSNSSSIRSNSISARK
jgi:hypothetical protein